MNESVLKQLGESEKDSILLAEIERFLATAAEDALAPERCAD
jgi:hypothetical protein